MRSVYFDVSATNRRSSDMCINVEFALRLLTGILFFSFSLYFFNVVVLQCSLFVKFVCEFIDI